MFEKVISIITVIMAAIGCFLSIYIYFENKESEQPNLYSTYTITPEFEEPSKDGPKKVRLNVYISNAGKLPVEIPPSLKIITLDSKDKVIRDVTAFLMSKDEMELKYSIQNMLNVGEIRMYSTSYSEMGKFFTPYMSHLINLQSDDSLFVAYMPSPPMPEELEELFKFEDGLFYSHFGNLQIAPKKLVLQN